MFIVVACFVHVAGWFSSFRLYFPSYNLLIGWQVLGFQILSILSTSAKVLRLTMSDENLEVDYDFDLLFLQLIDVLLL